MSEFSLLASIEGLYRVNYDGAGSVPSVCALRQLCAAFYLYPNLTLSTKRALGALKCRMVIGGRLTPNSIASNRTTTPCHENPNPPSLEAEQRR